MSMYAFCAAVIISLCTGVVIENLDEELRAREEDAGALRRLDPAAVTPTVTPTVTATVTLAVQPPRRLDPMPSG
jgi:hypothetical protein